MHSGTQGAFRSIHTTKLFGISEQRKQVYGLVFTACFSSKSPFPSRDDDKKSVLTFFGVGPRHQIGQNSRFGVKFGVSSLGDLTSLISRNLWQKSGCRVIWTLSVQKIIPLHCNSGEVQNRIGYNFSWTLINH